MNEKNELQILHIDEGNQMLNPYSGAQSFAAAQQMAVYLSESDMVPEQYRKKPANCMIAIEIAHRFGMTPFPVMQNLDIIKGKPGWNSKFVIAQINTHPNFEFLRFEFKHMGVKDITYMDGYRDNKQQKTIRVHDTRCTAWTYDKKGEVVVGATVSIEMAVKEGWYTKDGSKWPTMPQVMLQYRAAKFFGNMYCPERILGLMTSDELNDIDHTPQHSAPGIRTTHQDVTDVDHEEIKDSEVPTHKRPEKAKTPTAVTNIIDSFEPEPAPEPEPPKAKAKAKTKTPEPAPAEPEPTPASEISPMELEGDPEELI